MLAHYKALKPKTLVNTKDGEIYYWGNNDNGWEVGQRVGQCYNRIATFVRECDAQTWVEVHNDI